ncbi:hypothetical protein DFH06DRAFT_1135754 [Mycena polygramma]|nr:hypothetical protein DFH06DRAFT_1135754 [Mycena polygramma]
MPAAGSALLARVLRKENRERKGKIEGNAEGGDVAVHSDTNNRSTKQKKDTAHPAPPSLIVVEFNLTEWATFLARTRKHRRHIAMPAEELPLGMRVEGFWTATNPVRHAPEDLLIYSAGALGALIPHRIGNVGSQVTFMEASVPLPPPVRFHNPISAYRTIPVSGSKHDRCIGTRMDAGRDLTGPPAVVRRVFLAWYVVDKNFFDNFRPKVELSDGKLNKDCENAEERETARKWSNTYFLLMTTHGHRRTCVNTHLHGWARASCMTMRGHAWSLDFCPIKTVIVPVEIVNQFDNATMFTFDGPPPLEVLTPYYAGRTDQHPWDRFEVGVDAWIFQNKGTEQWLSVDEENGHLVTVSNLFPTVFAVEKAGRKELVIKLPFKDEVWEPFWDGTSMTYSRVMLRPATGDVSQHWMYKSGIREGPVPESVG